MKLSEFDFDLPPERIAQHPSEQRDAARLLQLNRQTGKLGHHLFRDLPDLLQPGDLIIVNRTRVIRARLLAQRQTGGRVEVLLVRHLREREWEALLRPSARLRAGERVTVAPELEVQIEPGPVGADGRRRVRLIGPGGETIADVERHGHVPLPPYIERADEALDHERYQTIFARDTGSIAAPTAGLHFTPALLERLAARGIERAEIVLHVGPGTFQPVRTEDVEQHRLPPEAFSIPADTAAAIAQTRSRGGRIVAVGTTTTRALEAAAGPNHEVRPLTGETDLVIVPGYRFRVVDVLITNFHLPRSSLLLLVSAFAGTPMVRAAYAAAIEASYRFYSYGDAMLID